MKLSHYQRLHPEMDGGQGQQRGEADRKPLPSDDQPAVRLLEPGQGPLSLEPRDVHLDGSASRVFRGPDAFRDLRPEAASAELLTEGVRLVALIRHEDLGPFPGA